VGSRLPNGDTIDSEWIVQSFCVIRSTVPDICGIVSKRKDSPYRSGRSPDWFKMKNSDAPAVKREAEEDWGKQKWR
jgi:hypothetical protein